MSPRTASTRPGTPGCAACSAGWPRTAAPSWSPATCSGEVAQTADHVIIVSAGALRFAGPLRELGDGALEPAFLRLTGEAGHAVADPR